MRSRGTFPSVVLVAAVILSSAACARAPQPSRVTALGPTRATTAPDGFSAVRTLARHALPVRLRIAAIGVDARVTRLGRLTDGTVDVPRSWSLVGWYAGGPRPGEPGPAVLLGHVDSRSGPAVFARLAELRAGDAIQVVGADGLPIPFRVERVQRYPKTRFPTEDVYLPTLRPELRLVTCGGAFDRTVGHYVDNVVVFAALDG